MRKTSHAAGKNLKCREGVGSRSFRGEEMTAVMSSLTRAGGCGWRRAQQTCHVGSEGWPRRMHNSGGGSQAPRIMKSPGGAGVMTQ